MIFWSKKALDNLPFQPYYSILHTISFQKMYIIPLAQFIPKKNVSHLSSRFHYFIIVLINRSEMNVNYLICTYLVVHLYHLCNVVYHQLLVPHLCTNRHHISILRDPKLNLIQVEKYLRKYNFYMNWIQVHPKCKHYHCFGI